MEVLERMSAAGVVPVVVLDRAEDAVPTARAMLAGGIDVMEITFRTAAAADAIRAVAEQAPEMLVGAGTVINLEQARKAVDCGAKFIVSPGYDEEVVSWCCDNGIPVTPGCVTPTEITAALNRHGLKVLKFFPANVYGGLSAINALAGPFAGAGVKFIPTGGVNQANLAEFSANPYIHAVGGSWVCPKAEIAAGKFEKITALCAEARKAVLGYAIEHVGINCADADAALAVTEAFCGAFGFAPKYGNSSNFAGQGIEVMKKMYYGKNGHLAVLTNKMEAAVADMQAKDYTLNRETASYKDGRMTVVYLNEEIGGFAVHLKQR